MVAVISAVCDQKLTMTQAAQSFGVPHKTFDNQIKNKVVHSTHSGPLMVLISKEECFILCTWHSSYPLNHTLTKALTRATLDLYTRARTRQRQHFLCIEAYKQSAM